MTTLTHHGGRIDHAAALYPDAPGPWIDLSTGVNPVAWVPPPSLAIDWARLPSPAALADLEDSAAAFFGAPAGSVVAVPGTEIALRLLRRLDLPPPFRFVVPSYRTHAAAFGDGSPVAIDDVGPAGGTLLFANPNNPDGRVLDRAPVQALAVGRWLVIDEAFADCDPSWSMVPDLPPDTIVLRSFGKFFGLAGVRLGFVIGPEAIAARVRAMLGDWPVSAAAIAFGAAAYRDADWIGATRKRIVDDGAALDVLLRRHGLDPVGDCPLFRLVGGDAGLFARLANAGILTRPFEDAPGVVRFGLPGDAQAWERLDAALGGG